MATKICPKCKEEIQSDASKCKHCNADLRNWFIKHKIITGILVLLVIGIIGSSLNKSNSIKTVENSLPGNSVKETQVIEPPIKITAVELVKAYEENEVKADQTYKGKTAIITGTIKDIGVMFSQTFVTLSSGKEFSISDIQCFFTDQTQIDKVAKLSKGSQLTVQCKIDGKSLNVSVRDCIIQ